MPMTILMSRPTNFEIAYEINPWMHTTDSVNKKHAMHEWKTLYNEIAQRVTIEEIPYTNHPDFVFTANAGLVRGREIILSSFLFAERQREETDWKTWFEEAGYITHKLQNTSFEGAGDALFADDTLIAGYGHRTHYDAYDQIADIWDIDIVRVELVDERFYHLDTCLCVLDANTLLYYPQAFSEESRRTLKQRFTCIEVPASEAIRFACNAVVLDTHIILPSGAPRTSQLLKQHGWTSTEVSMQEFLKSGGAAKCLTLAI